MVSEAGTTAIAPPDARGKTFGTSISVVGTTSSLGDETSASSGRGTRSPSKYSFVMVDSVEGIELIERETAAPPGTGIRCLRP